jgi:hypothetical protein
MSNQRLMKRYLLGRATPEERADLENEYLSNANVFEELAEAENDLIDGYVKDKLTDSDAREFERQYMSSSKGRARVQFARAFAEVSRGTRPTTSAERMSLLQRWTLPFHQARLSLQWGLALSAVAVILAFGWLGISHHRATQAGMQKPFDNQRGTHTPPARTQPLNGTSVPGTEIAQNAAPPLADYTVQLSPGLARGVGTSPKVFPFPKTQWVRFRLVLENNEDRGPFTASLETPEGQLIERVEGIRSSRPNRTQVVELRISSSLIPVGDYILRLSEKAADGSEEELDSYTFRVSSK